MNFFDKKTTPTRSPARNSTVEVGAEISLRSIDGQLYNCFTLVPVKKGQQTGSANYIKCKYLLAVTDSQLIEMYPHPNKIGMAVTAHVHLLTALAKLRFKKGDPGVLILEFKSGKVSKLIMNDPGTCVDFLKSKMKQMGIRGNLKPKSEKDIANAQACFKRAKEIETEFSRQQSIDLVREMMDLLRRAAEKFSEANDEGYTEVTKFINQFLTRADVAKLLDENSAAGLPGISMSASVDEADEEDPSLGTGLPPVGSVQGGKPRWKVAIGQVAAVNHAMGKGGGGSAKGGLAGLVGMLRSGSIGGDSSASNSGQVSRSDSMDATFGISGSEFENGDRVRSASSDISDKHPGIRLGVAANGGNSPSAPRSPRSSMEPVAESPLARSSSTLDPAEEGGSSKRTTTGVAEAAAGATPGSVASEQKSQLCMSFSFQLPDETEELTALEQALIFALNEDDRVFDLVHGQGLHDFLADEEVSGGGAAGSRCDEEVEAAAAKRAAEEAEAERKRRLLMDGDKELTELLTTMHDEFRDLLQSFKEAKPGQPRIKTT